MPAKATPAVEVPPSTIGGASAAPVSPSSASDWVDQARGQVVVQLGGRKQRYVQAGDAGAGGRQRCLRLPTQVAQPVCESEQPCRNGRSQQDATAWAHPAALIGEHVEEEDAEQRDHSADPGQRSQPEEIGQVELATLPADTRAGGGRLTLEPARPRGSGRPRRGPR
jgi:hypothetical protein